MKLKFIAAAASLGAIVMAAGAASADDLYLKGTDLVGDSKAKGREGQVQLVSVTDGMGGVASATTGARTGKITFSDISFTKFVDGSSVKFREYALTGRRIPSIEIDFTKQNARADLTYRISLKNALVTSVASSGAASNSATASEDITLSFEEITWSVPKMRPDGSSGESLTYGWSVVQNKKVP